MWGWGCTEGGVYRGCSMGVAVDRGCSMGVAVYRGCSMGMGPPGGYALLPSPLTRAPRASWAPPPPSGSGPNRAELSRAGAVGNRANRAEQSGGRCGAGPPRRAGGRGGGGKGGGIKSGRGDRNPEAAVGVGRELGRGGGEGKGGGRDPPPRPAPPCPVRCGARGAERTAPGSAAGTRMACTPLARAHSACTSSLPPRSPPLPPLNPAVPPVNARRSRCPRCPRCPSSRSSLPSQPCLHPP